MGRENDRVEPLEEPAEGARPEQRERLHRPERAEQPQEEPAEGDVSDVNP